MTTLFVLDYLMVDNTHSQEKEFADKAAVYAWLLGQRETDFGYITLFHGENEPVDGWSDVIAFCRPVLTATEILARNDLSQCGDACNCMKCNPSKSSCIALRASELNTKVIDRPAVLQLEPGDLSGLPTVMEAEMVLDELLAPKPDTTDASLPRMERFIDIPDGSLFYLAQTYAYGGRQKLQKTMEDGGPHNACYAVYGGIGLHINDDRLVIRVD